MKKNDTWVTILEFSYPHEAAIARGRLESEGIECFLRNENTASVLPYLPYSVLLQVKTSDVSNAKIILKDGGFI